MLLFFFYQKSQQIHISANLKPKICADQPTSCFPFAHTLLVNESFNQCSRIYLTHLSPGSTYLTGLFDDSLELWFVVHKNSLKLSFGHDLKFVCGRVFILTNELLNPITKTMQNHTKPVWYIWLDCHLVPPAFV